jgi:hypothetical protein
MKRAFIMLIMVVAVLSSLNAQKSKVAYEPKGKWLFEAPYAPEGYTAGVIEVGTSENKLAATVSLTGNDAKIPLENVKFVNDTLTCNIVVEEATVLITLKFDEADKMSGKAVTPDGEVPLAMARDKKK